jgi:hypothetical protein
VRGLALASRVLPLVLLALPPLCSDVEAQLGGRSNICLNRVVPSVLELDGTVRTTDRYWSQWVVGRCQLLIDLFKFKFDHLNINFIVF